ncbi:DUF2860 family protein [Thaumasiovibrio subtropicus]|uniref:DUF2860 family protein n=1 Tax=Thaumasiovibrio subtropicus TaxID=1891207 RepID=UPI00131D4199|nr:DUF2860 family protein [Thaumasiovibrio subtropicus]
MKQYANVILGTMAVLHSAAFATTTEFSEDSGFSGAVGAGIAIFDVKSNFLGGNRFADLDNSNTDSLFSSPSQARATSPDIQIDVRYTFEGSKTEIMLGNALADLVRLDFSQQLGIRHKRDDLGVFSAGYLFSSLPAEVWQDPFKHGVERTRVERDARGVRFGWDSMFGQPVGVSYSYRNVEVEHDRSGETLVNEGILTVEQAAMLKRDGDIHKIDLISTIDLGAGKVLIPEASYARHDRIGAASSMDVYVGQLSYLKFTPNYTLALSAMLSDIRYDAENPVFERKANTQGVGLAGSLLLRNVLNHSQWDVLIGLAWTKAESDIAFYDTEILAGNVSLLYRF